MLLVKPMKACLILTFSVLFFGGCFSQKDTTQLYKKRSAFLYTAYTGVAVGGYFGLNQLWYADHPKSSFHFFNDADQWRGMDKIGHAFSSYYLSELFYHRLRWAGKTERSAAVQSFVGSTAMMLTIEILDGFSQKWGASISDFGFNLLGSSLNSLQYFVFKKQIATLKFSFSKSGLAPLRPDALGDTYAQQLFKDYNGQTYWVNLPISLVFKKVWKPLNLSLGYSANGMLGGKSNPTINEMGELLPNFQRSSSYILSLDVNLKDIKTNKKWLKKTLALLNVVKIPLPAISITSKGNFKAHGLYF